jgi:sulfate transport system permease protein
MTTRKTNILPGFGLSLGFTIFYLSVIVLIPLSAAFFKTVTVSWPTIWETISSPRVVASYRLSFGVSAVAALVNGFFGFLVAWVLVRYLPGQEDRGRPGGPALRPAHGGGRHRADRGLRAQRLIGSLLAPLGIKVAFTPLGVGVALVFIGLPFVVRTVQPVLEDLDAEIEEAAASLGANRWQTISKVVFPTVLPALLTGTAMSFARAVGEYGSVVFISGNMPMKTEITPLLIITKLEQYDYAGATALAVVMLVVSFALLLSINLLQAWSGKR